MNLGHDVRARRQGVGDAIGKLHEAVPRRPASEPLTGLLNREHGGSDDATVTWQVLESRDPARCREAEIDNRPLSEIRATRFYAVAASWRTRSGSPSCQ